MSEDGPLYAYLDTNAFLEFRPFWENDWLRELSTKHAVLVVAGVVFDELQDVKDAGPSVPRRKRDRAHNLMKRLEQDLFPDSEPPAEVQPVRIRDGVELSFDGHAPSLELLAAHHLDPTRADNRLLAAILAARSAGRNVCLVTHDISARARAKSRGVRCYDLPLNWKFAEEPDPAELEIRKLKQRLLTYESRLPDLKLGFAEHDAVLRRTVCRPRSPEETTSIVEACKFEVPLWEERHAAISMLDAMHSAAGRYVSSSEVEKYDRDVLEFRERWVECLPEMLEHQCLLDRHLEIDLVVRNTGTAPARDVEINIMVPNPVTVVASLPKGPARPKAPRMPKPTSPFDNLRDRIREYAILEERLSSAFRVKPLEPQRTEWSIRGERAQFAIRKVKHAQQEQLPKLYLVLPSFDAAGSFSLQYEVHADDVVAPTQGRLDVVVSKADRPSKFDLFVAISEEEDP